MLVPGKQIPQFWYQALQEWSIVNFKKANACSKDTMVFFNSNIKTTLVFKGSLMYQYHAQDVLTINDVLQCKLALPYLTNIVRAIRRRWLELQFAALSAQLDINQLLSTHAINLWMQNLNRTTPVITWDKWVRDSGSPLIGQSWTQICRIRSHFVSIKLQSFYWQYIHHAMFTNDKSCRYGMTGDPSCTFCKVETETFADLYWECEHVQWLLQQLIKWCQTYIDNKVVYDRATCLILGF